MVYSTLTLYDGSIGSSPSLVRTTSDSNLVNEGWNDRASSAVVSGGCRWILYEHINYYGTSAVISAGRYNFYSRPSVFPNNTLTALYCLPAEGNPAIVLFEHDNYHGRRRVLTSSNRNLGSFNDKVSSFIITGGKWQLYTHENYQGSDVIRGQGLYPTPSSLSPVADDALTSVRLVGKKISHTICKVYNRVLLMFIFKSICVAILTLSVIFCRSHL